VALEEACELFERPDYSTGFLLERTVVPFRQRILTAGVRNGHFFLALVVELKKHSTRTELT
jgi:hypothetical protein